MTLVFDNGERTEHVNCARLQQLAPDVQRGDYIACPFSGFVHVHEVRVEGNTVFLTDCHDFEHIYSASKLLEIARPVREADG